MPKTLPETPLADPSPPTGGRVGCVSFLNATPLIEGLEDLGEDEVVLDVPSGLLRRLESDEVDVALCPVIDYFRSAASLEVIPVGAISCAGPTLTVRLFSRVEAPRIERVHVDMDSHTSVVLLRVLLAQCFQVRPELVPYHPERDPAPSDACMLIGDKVVTAPPAIPMPHQIDLGELWHTTTGLPFVFAIWMRRSGVDIGNMPQRLAETRRRNADRIEAIAHRHAAEHGWSVPVARRYLGSLLHFHVTSRHLRAIETFAEMAVTEGILPKRRKLQLCHACSEIATDPT